MKRTADVSRISAGKPMRSFHFVDKSCHRRKEEVSWVRRFFLSNGWTEAAAAEKADCVILFTCAEMRYKEANMIREVERLSGRIGRDAEFIVGSCLPKTNKEALAKGDFDLVVGDEFYDIVTEISRDKAYNGPPMIAIWDFLGFDAVSMSPKERLFVYIMNRSWTKPNPRFNLKKMIMIGELEDIPDRSLGLGLPSRRAYTKSNFECVGYVFPFDPANFLDKIKIRQELGYGSEPLIIASAGGTAIGRPLLDLCCSAYSLMKRKIPDLRMVVVAGPRIPPESIKKVDGVEVQGYVPELYKHFAASDFGICMGGGTTTLELTALRVPFAFFPLEKHFEQELLIAERCRRIGAGINMKFSSSTPEMLAEVAIQNIGKKVTYQPIRTNGAENAGKVINGVMA